jgi:hypothetical protein
MSAEEKAASDRVLQRYVLSEAEQRVYELGLQYCLRCEAPASAFRAADASDLDRAAGHLVTPVYVEPMVGTH